MTADDPPLSFSYRRGLSPFLRALFIIIIIIIIIAEFLLVRGSDGRTDGRWGAVVWNGSNGRDAPVSDCA